MLWWLLIRQTSAKNSRLNYTSLSILSEIVLYFNKKNNIEPHNHRRPCLLTPELSYYIRMLYFVYVLNWTSTRPKHCCRDILMGTVRSLIQCATCKRGFYGNNFLTSNNDIWLLVDASIWYKLFDERCCHTNLCFIQYIPRNMHTVFALLCFVVVIHWLIFSYQSGLLHWHCGNLTIAPVPAKQPWWIWINTSCEFIMNDCITTTKQSTTKPSAYLMGYVGMQSNERHGILVGQDVAMFLKSLFVMSISK